MSTTMTTGICNQILGAFKKHSKVFVRTVSYTSRAVLSNITLYPLVNSKRVTTQL